MRTLIRYFLIFLAAATGAAAQSPLEKAVVCAGVTRTVSSVPYAWIALQPTDLALTKDRSYAIYRKTGVATSGNSYSRLTVLAPVTDPLLAAAILPQAVVMGENLATLDEVLTDLLGNPSGTPTTAQKLASYIASALRDPARSQEVLMLARTHPGIAMAAGLGFPDRMPASSAHTWEIRDFNAATGNDNAVIGRVTLNPASPVVLPAPGAPVEVPDPTAKAHLNIALRWATPDALLDRTPLISGFDVYRVPKNTTETRGWHTTPPANAGTLLTEPTARKVNTSPVLPAKTFTALNVADFTADPATMYLIDDNGRHNPGGEPFKDAQSFYYFAAARDLLGQPGTPSPGALLTICDRMPPPVPVQVKVAAVTRFDNALLKDIARFELSWEMPPLPANEGVANFLVYRWRSATEHLSARHIDPSQKLPDQNLVAVLPGTQTSFTDNQSVAAPIWADWNGGTDNGTTHVAPSAGADAGKTFFYTVRAVDMSICRNASGNSSPAWGVLRDRSGPVGTTGSLLTPCKPLLLSWMDYAQTDETGLNEEFGHLRMVCTSSVSAGLSWAEWELVIPNVIGNTFLPLGRATFARNNAGQQRAELFRDVPQYHGTASFRCRVGTSHGVISAWVQSALDSPSPLKDKRLRVRWNASFGQETLVPVGQCGNRHILLDSLTSDLKDLCGTFTPTTGTTEFKVYRVVDGGPQTMVDSGPVSGSAPVIWKDSMPPAALSQVCYYLQLFDKNGNPSPLVLQDCVESGSGSLLPVPMLEKIETAGTPFAAQMRVRWFCSMAGVDRFELWVARKSGQAPASGTSLSADLADHPNALTDIAGTEGLDFSVFETAAVRLTNPTGTPEFEYLLPVSAREVYTVLVRAVGRGKYDSRVVGGFSSPGSFTWLLRTAAPAGVVAWPNRNPPPVADFHPGIEAVFINKAQLNPWKGNMVRIGEYKDVNNSAQTTTFMANDQFPDEPRAGRISGTTAPAYYLYCNDEVAAAESAWEGKTGSPGCLFPVALYRVQMPSLRYPVVPGDIVQCTPLMENIASKVQAGQTIVLDPFVLPLHMDDTGLPRTISGTDHDLMLIDRQPVIKAARYKYLLVRFGLNKEIERIISTSEVAVP